MRMGEREVIAPAPGYATVYINVSPAWSMRWDEEIAILLETNASQLFFCTCSSHQLGWNPNKDFVFPQGIKKELTTQRKDVDCFTPAALIFCEIGEFVFGENSKAVIKV